MSMIRMKGRTRALGLGLLAVTLAGAPGPSELSAQEPRTFVRTVRPQGWIGVTFDLELQTAFQAGAAIATPSIVISQVYRGSPAERAGLQAGDTIVRINGQAANAETLLRIQETLEPGTTLRFQLRRGGRLRTAEVRAGTRPADHELETLPPQVRVRVETAQAALLQQLDSVARTGVVSASEGLRTVYMMRSQGDSVTVTFQGFPGAAAGDAFDRSWAAAAGAPPAPPAPFRGVIVRQQPPGAPEVSLEVPRGPSATLTGTLAAQRAVDAAQSELAATARALATLEEHRRPLAPYILGQDVILGAKLAPLNAGLSEYFGVSRGLLVVSVLEDTPAADAGVQPGDVIVSSGTRALASIEELRALFTTRGSGPVALTLVRKGRPLQVQVPR